MTKVTKIILGLSLLTIASTKTAAGQFARNAWKFLKSPMTLGVMGSASFYMIKQEERKNNYTKAKSDGIKQTLEENRLMIKKIYQGLDTPEANTVLARAQNKKDIRNRLAKKHGASPDFVVFDGERPSPLGCITYKDRFGIIIGKEKTKSPQHLEHIVGHEYIHFKHQDEDTDIFLDSTVPIATTTAYKIPQWVGRGGKLASLTLAGITACIAHPLARAQFSQFCEHRADREASSDPEVLEASANAFMHYEIQRELSKQIQKSLASESEQIITESHIEKKINKLFSSHPTDGERGKRLYSQAVKLRAEQKKIQDRMNKK